MFGRLLSALAGTLGAALGSQAPAFLTQYRQQLAARLDQLRESLAQVFAAARAEGLSPAEFLARAASEGGTFSQAVIADARHSLARLAELQSALDALVASAAPMRPLLFLAHFDRHVASDTLAHFSPAVPLTLEGLAYAGLGLLLGLLLLTFLESCGRLLLAWFRRPRYARAR